MKGLVFLGAGLTAALIGCIYMLDRSERAELAAFYNQCRAIPKSEAECNLLLSLKRSSDSAAISAGFAAGAAGASAAFSASR